MESRNFTKVFGSLEMPSAVRTGLRSLDVEGVSINRSVPSIEICLKGSHIVNESHIDKFRQCLLRSLGYVKKADIKIKYDIKDDVSVILNSYFGNILSAVENENRFCRFALEKSKPEIKENKIVFELGCVGAFLLYKNKTDRVIKELLRDRFGLEYDIEFKDSKAPLKIVRREETRTERSSEDMYTDEYSGRVPTEKRTENRTVASPKPEYKKMPRFSSRVTEITEEPIPIRGNIIDGKEVVFAGRIIKTEITETRKKKYIVKMDITDDTYSVTVKFFTDPEEYEDSYRDIVEYDKSAFEKKKLKYVIVKGVIGYDSFADELILNMKAVSKGQPPKLMRADNAEKKRVELHLHTNLSEMDGVSSFSSYVQRAAEWGHRAIALTDHGVVQAYPEAMSVSKEYGVKVLYGCEAYLMNDIDFICQGSADRSFSDEFVVFDIETTGLKKETDKIIEIGAVKLKNGQKTDEFSALINPGRRLTEEITKLTGITDEDLADKPSEDVVVPQFIDFCRDAVIVGHNVGFDIGFIRKFAVEHGIFLDNTVIDTMGLSQLLFGKLKNHKLDTVCSHLGVSLHNHHRAVDDATATAGIFSEMTKLLEKRGVSSVKDINAYALENMEKNNINGYYHAIILVSEQQGIRNLYELISDAHLKYFKRRPRIPKSELIRLRDGLIVGSACEAGELFTALYEDAPESRIKELVDFYDYLEIQPIDNNEFMIDNKSKSGKAVRDREKLIEINKRITALGEKYNKPVAATCDCHFLDPEDELYRRIIMVGSGFEGAEKQPPLFYRTTEEMLEEFDYLGKEKAYEVVVENTNKIADMIGDILPIPNGTYAPHIEGADEQLRDICYKKAHEIYGDKLPDVVKDRLETELSSIISNGYGVLYVIAQRLVWNSNENGYPVGSRGSVGSSFAATMAGITEVNPLEPHYYCPKCRYSDFDSDIVKKMAGTSGFDLPDRKCPVCNTELIKEGQAIPFQTFLGFEGDKEPDIDLNFSGEYQAGAHKYTEELFGKDFVFKAGTISALKEKTAYGYVKKYIEQKGLSINNAEINRLDQRCMGIKKTTGQHPGGLMVVPSDNSIYNFCPIQHPANKISSDVIITHFDYHSISGRLLKLDELGHDVPTIMHMYREMTGVDPVSVPMGDKKVMSLFTSPEALGLTPQDLGGIKTGSLGLPEFGTENARQMLIETQPTTFSELVRLSGLAHGTDVWAGNAQELIRNKTATLKEVIATRDDIMTYLISMGIPNKDSFTIMESVRKGKGLTPEWEALMREHNVPEWYIESCKKIKYMFPKGHAAAYVTSAVRIGYFKIYYPYAFYAAIFSMKLDQFSYRTCCFGRERVLARMKEIDLLGKEASDNDKKERTVLELVNEMYLRGLRFVPMDLYRSDSAKFVLTDEGMLPPFATIPKLGGTAAQSIVEARADGEFETVEDFMERTTVGKKLVDVLREEGLFRGIPETRQITLDMMSGVF